MKTRARPRPAGRRGKKWSRSALRSRRRKAPAYQSAMSMLNFYINRAGKGLSGSQKRVLEGAKRELRKMFGRDGHHARSGRSLR